MRATSARDPRISCQHPRLFYYLFDRYRRNTKIPLPSLKQRNAPLVLTEETSSSGLALSFGTPIVMLSTGVCRVVKQENHQRSQNDFHHPPPVALALAISSLL